LIRGQIYIQLRCDDVMSLDVIDFTQLEKRGLLKQEKTQKEIGVIDFSSPSGNASAPASATNDNAFDLLSGLAQASTNTSSDNAIKGNENISSHNDLSFKMDGVLNKLDDLMYKIETLSSRLAQMENRIGKD